MKGNLHTPTCKVHYSDEIPKCQRGSISGLDCVRLQVQATADTSAAWTCCLVQSRRQMRSGSEHLHSWPYALLQISPPLTLILGLRWNVSINTFLLSGIGLAQKSAYHPPWHADTNMIGCLGRCKASAWGRSSAVVWCNSPKSALPWLSCLAS